LLKLIQKANYQELKAIRTAIKQFVIVFALLLAVITGCSILQESAKCDTTTNILIDLDTVLTNVSHHPIGINVNFFMDSDYFGPKRSTVDALKAMGVKYLRYPGGEKSDMYLWSVPPYDKPQPTMARTGKGAVRGREPMLENYATFKYDVLDFDEFMQMCREVGAEPVIVVAADEYLNDYPEGCTITEIDKLIEAATEWVRYANIKKKYNVKYWMIGNETWHPANSKETPEIYVKDLIAFSKAMKAVDPTIKIIPNGKGLQWWKKILPAVSDHIDGLCVSNYAVASYDISYEIYRDSLVDLMIEVNAAAEAIGKFVPDPRKEEFKIIVAEYGPFDWKGKWPHINDMGHALASFEMTGEQLKHPKVEFSLFWNTRWIKKLKQQDQTWDTLDKNGNFNATGYALALWGNFLSSKMVYTSATVRIRTFASYDAEKKQLYVYAINKSDNEEKINLNVKGGSVDSIVQRWELAGKDPKDTDPVFRKIESASLSADPLILVVPGVSISVIEYKLK